MSHQAKKTAEWKQAQHFVAKDSGFLTIEERDLLEDWGFLLCDTSALESVAFLPRLQRCFKRVDLFLSEHCEVLKKIGAKNLQIALRTKTMQELPPSMFSRVFLEKYTEQLSIGQMEAIALWEKNLCEFSTADREALTARFVRVQNFFSDFAVEIVGLQKPNLRSVVMSRQANEHAEWMQARNFFIRDYPFLTEEKICLLEDWELVLCDTSVAFLPRVETSVGRHLYEAKDVLKKRARREMLTGNGGK